MPAPSKAMRRLTAIALHHPEEVSEKNRSILSMKKSDMKDFASTSEKNLPYKSHGPRGKKT